MRKALTLRLFKVRLGSLGDLERHVTKLMAEPVSAVLLYEAMIVSQRYLPFNLPFANERNLLKRMRRRFPMNKEKSMRQRTCTTLLDDLDRDSSSRGADRCVNGFAGRFGPLES